MATGTIPFDGFKAGDSYPANSNSVFSAIGWVTGGLKTIDADIILPKPCPSTVTPTFMLNGTPLARGVNGYVNGSNTGLTPDSYRVFRRSDYILTLRMEFTTELTNVINNTPVGLYINGRITFS